MSVMIYSALLVIFCLYRSCVANASFYCHSDQTAKLGDTFTVKCNSSTDLWRSVHYIKESEKLLIAKCEKLESCEEDNCVKGGSGVKYGRRNVTEEGLLVFNEVTMDDEDTYTMEYHDCDDNVHSLMFSITVQDKVTPTEFSGLASLTNLVIIAVVVIVVVGGTVVFYLCKRKSGRNVKTSSGGQASYSAVKGEGPHKVYNETTEEIA